ncbi:MAG: hypothetical protein Q7R96_00515 [Nanoarchaeota archaeon]|nr:hypothetical protein [Nanoarchaeota archaeon]
MADKPTNMGTASLVLGIVSIILCWVPFLGVITGIIGIILAGKQKKIFPTGIATAGFITSIVGLVFSGFYLIFWIFFAAAFATALSAVPVA